MIHHVRELPVERPPALVHPGWRDAFPWLVQGTTVRGPGDAPFDLGLFSGGSPQEAVRRRWSDLVASLEMDLAVHSPQPHGSVVGVWPDDTPEGAGRDAVGRGQDAKAVGQEAEEHPGRRSLHRAAPLALVEARDGHLTAEPGVLLAVTVADCVPVFVVDPVRKAVAMVHAGWRGAAAGILEEGLAAMRSTFGTSAEDVHLHLGPAICGDCYEVGPEVFRAFGLQPPPGPAPIDVREILAGRAVAAAVDPERLTVSEHCTRCTDSGLFSHRAGDAHRQVGYLGIRT